MKRNHAVPIIFLIIQIIFFVAKLLYPSRLTWIQTWLPTLAYFGVLVAVFAIIGLVVTLIYIDEIQNVKESNKINKET